MNHANSPDSPIFNLPFVASQEDRGQVYASIYKAFADGRTLDILEIGVFRGGIIRSIFANCPEIVKTYTGVDPYLGNPDDPYFNAYWKGSADVAEKQYVDSEALFAERGATLVRKTSDQFFAEPGESFDLILVDGDHRFAPALRDLTNALTRLRPGGLLVCDDYGNSDSPDVTRAVVRFCARAGDFYDASGYRPIWFENAGKPAPIQLSIIFWRKKLVDPAA